MKKTTARPRLFIGSSSESRQYAYAIQEELEESAEATVWSQNLFRLTKTTIENLMDALEEYDFAVFVFAPNDIVRLRGKNYPTVRDNVVFELGLFMGKLGRPRVFMAIPKGSEHLRLPTDLAGVTPGKFDSNRGDKNFRAAVGPFCNKVRGEIRRYGKVKVAVGTQPFAKRSSRSKDDLVVLEALYGAQNRFVDIASKINTFIVDNKLHILIGNYLAEELVLHGDPCPNVLKKVTVRYKYKGKVLTKTANETEYLDLP